MRKIRSYQREFAISAMVCIFSLLVLARYVWQEWHSAHEAEKLRKIYEITESVSQEAERGYMDTREEKDPFLTRTFDWKGLQELNPDIMAWITIPGTLIDYPVCCSAETNQYLNHGADGSYDYYGTIFLSSDVLLSDSHLLIYGHNIRSGKMFGQLRKYRDPKFEKEHPYVYIYTSEASFKAEIFSCYSCLDGSRVYETGFSVGTWEYQKWLNDISKQSEYNCGVNVSSTNQSYTLSTCVSGNKKEERYVVNAIVTQIQMTNPQDTVS